MFILFIPLCLLKDLRPDYMSAGFWRLIFLRLAGLPSLASRFQEKKIATTCAILTVISCIVAAQNIPAQESFFERESRIFKNLLRSSAPFLENCNHTDRVVIKNLDIALGNTAKAEIAIWAFRSEYLKTRFYLQRPASNPGIQNSIDPYLWVNESQTIGHPVLNIGAKSADE